MKPVKDFQGYWNAEKRAIHFRWDIKGMGNDRYIYIVPVEENDGRRKVNTAKSIVFDISDMSHATPNGTVMPVSDSGIGVYKMYFCAYSLPQATVCRDEKILQACASDPAYMTTVIMGRAAISYAAECTVVDNAKLIKLHLKSDSDIAEGVLGYRYTIDSGSIVNLFPQRIGKGRTSFPAVLIPKNCDIEVVPVDKQFSGNLSITAKKSRFTL